MTRSLASDPEYVGLLADKAKKLEDLQKCKCSQKGYKKALREFLDADAKAEEALLKHIVEMTRIRAESPTVRTP